MKLNDLVIARIDGLQALPHGALVSRLSQASSLPEGWTSAPIGWSDTGLRDALLVHPWLLEQTFGAASTRLLAAELYKVDLTAVHEGADGAAATRMLEIRLGPNLPRDHDLVAQACQRVSPTVNFLRLGSSGLPVPIEVVVMRPAARMEPSPGLIPIRSLLSQCVRMARVLRYATVAGGEHDYLVLERPGTEGLSALEAPGAAEPILPGLSDRIAWAAAKGMRDALGIDHAEPDPGFGIVATATVSLYTSAFMYSLRVADRTPYLSMSCSTGFARSCHVVLPGRRAWSTQEWWLGLGERMNANAKVPPGFSLIDTYFDEAGSHIWLGPRCATWAEAYQVGAEAAASMGRSLAQEMDRARNLMVS